MAKALNVNLSVTADTGQAAAALANLQSQLNSLMTTPANFTIGTSLKEGAAEAAKTIAQLQTQLKNSTNSLTGNLDLTKFTQQMSASGMSLQKYQTTLNSLGTSGKQAFAQLASSIAQAEVPLMRSNGLLTEFWTTLKNTARWQISSSMLHGFIGTLQQAYGYAQDLNESLNNIQIVTGLSDTKMAQFAESANKAAKQLSTTTTSYTDAALIYYQQGIRDDKEIASRVETTIKLANVSGQSAEKVSNQMTAIWNNFADGSHNLEYYADVITALGAATASSSEEIATGLSKFAAVADTVGLSYENASAALATITATTRQSADTVGTGLRTLFSRLQSLKLGDTLEDGVDLTKYTKALETVGVSALDANGNLRAMDNILEDLGARWQTLSDAQKTALAQTVGGVRQYTTLIALMDNFDFYKENQAIALGSEGTVQKQADIYAKSWEAAAKRVKASAQSIYSDLIDDKFFIALNNGFAGFLDIIDSAIDGLGGLKGILLTIGGLLTTVFADKAAQGIISMVNTIKSLTTSGRQAIYDQQSQAVQALINSQSGSDLVSQNMASAYSQMGSLQQSYLTNAQKMNEAERQTASYLMQQQSALVENVRLRAQEAESAQKKSKADLVDARKTLNSSTYQTAAQVEKQQAYAKMTELQAKAVSLGRAEGAMNTLGTLDAQTASLQQMQETIQGLGATEADFAAHSTAAADAFRAFKDAVANNDITAAQQALEQLFNTMEAGGATAVDTLQQDIMSLWQQCENGTMTYEEFNATLTKMVNSAKNSGQALQETAASQSILKVSTEALKTAMAELAAQNYTTVDSIVAVAGALANIAMAANAIKSISNTFKEIQDGTKSVSDGLISIGTNLLPITLMLKNTKWDVLASLGAKLATSVPVLGSLSTGLAKVITGLTGASAAAAGFAASLGVFALVAAVVAGVAYGIYKLAEAIETPKERVKRLTTEAEASQEAAEDARQAYQDLLSLEDQHNGLLDTLNDLTEGTLEFRDALVQANAIARQLIEGNDLQYGTDWWYDEHGAIRFNQESLRAAEEKRVTLEERTAEAEAIAQALKEGSENAVSEIEASKRAQAQVEHHTGGYANILRNPNYPDIMEVTGMSAQDAISAVETLQNSGFSRIMQQYMGWLEEGNSGTYQDFYESKRNKAMDEEDENWDYYQQEWRDLQDYNPQYMQSMLDTQFANLFPEGSTLQTIAQGLQAEFHGINNPYESGIRQTNSALVGALKAMSRAEGNTEDDIASNMAIADLAEKYSDNSVLSALEQAIIQDIDDQVKGRGQYTQETAKTLAEQYKELYGYDPESTLTESELKNAIKQQRIHNALLEEFRNVQDQYTLDNMEQYEDFLNQNDTAVQGMINQLRTQYEGTTKSAAANAIADMMEEQVRQSYEDASYALLKNTDFDLSKNAKLLQNLTSAERTQLANAINTMASNFGRESATLLADAFNNDPELISAFADIDFSQGRLKAIQQIRQNGGFSQDLIDSMIDEAGGKVGLFEELYHSEEFSDNLKSLQKTFKKTGEIGADAILEIADDSDLLQQYLEECGISAAGLADALEMIELGDIGVDELTDDLLEALTAANELEQSLAESFNYIDNYNEKRSVRDLASWATGLIDDFEESYKAGFWSDPQLYQSLETLFGTKALNSWIEDAAYATDDKNWSFEQRDSYMNTQQREILGVMQAMQESNNFSPYIEYMAKHTGFGDIFSNRNGEIITIDQDELKAKGIESLQDLFDYGFSKNYDDLPEEIMQMAINEYLAANTDLNNYFQKHSVDEGLARLLGGVEGQSTEDLIKAAQQGSGVQGDGIITSAEVEAYYKKNSAILNELYGSEEGYLKAIKSLAEETGNTFLDLSNSILTSKKTYSELEDVFEQETGMGLDKYLESAGYSSEEGWKNIEKATSAYEKLGYTAKEAMALVEEQYEASGLSFDKFIGANEKQWERFCESMASEYGDNWQTALEEAGSLVSEWDKWIDTDGAAAALQEQAETFADAFMDALAGMEIELGEDFIRFKKPDTSEISDAIAEAGEEGGKTAGEKIAEGLIEGTDEASQQLQEKVANAIDTAIEEATKAAQSQIDEIVADAVQQITDERDSLQSALEEAQSAAEAKIAELNAAAEEAAAQYEQIRAEAETLKSEAEGFKADAEAAEQRAREAEFKAEQNAQQAEQAAREAENLKIAAEAAQHAADTAVANAAAWAAAAQAAQAAAETAAQAAQAIVSSVLSVLGGQIQGGYQNAAQNPGTPQATYNTEIQGMSSYDVGLMSAYAQAGYTSFDAIDWWRFRGSEMGQNLNAPSWSEISDRLAGTSLLNEDNTINQEVLSSLLDVTQQIAASSEDTATATDTLATEATAPEQKYTDASGQVKVETPITNTTITNTTTNAQTTVNNASASQVDLVAALKSAGVTQETYDATSLENTLSNLGSQIAPEISAAITQAYADNGGQMVSNEQFTSISAQIDEVIPPEDLPEVVVKGELELDESAAEEAAENVDPNVEGDLELNTDAAQGEMEALGDTPVEATVDYKKGEQEEPEEKETLVHYRMGSQAEPTPRWTSVNYSLGTQAAPKDMTAKVNYVRGTQEAPESQSTTQPKAMGYNNAAFAAGYAGAHHLGGTYQGLATVGELGPELMIHGNQAYLVGTHGRVTTYVQPDDQIYTAAQTKKILETNPLMRDIPGFSVGYPPTGQEHTWGDGSGSGSGSGGSGGSDNSSTKEIKETLWYPERYHLIERQIDDLTRAYEKLNKAKDRTYGANRLRAINDEIKAHKKLMEAQSKEIDEAKRWLEYDKAQLQQSGLWNEMQFDENGNIANFDELQEKYSRAIKQGLGITGEVSEEVYEANEDAKDEAQKKWDLITHYEETLDKLKDLDDDYLDSLYELADMLQELATTKVEIRVNVDQKDLDLLEHYINKIDDNIWATGDVLNLVGGKLANYSDQINIYKKGMDDLLKNATNAKGQAVPGLDLATWMAMTPEQRDALDLDSNLMEKIEEYEEEILKLLDNIEQLKTKGLEELAAAFDEVNSATQTSLAMFDNYSDTISRLKDMTEVQMAFKPTSDTNKLLDKMDRAAIRQNKDQLKARQAYTAELEKERAIIQELYDKEIDTDRKKLYQEQLDNFDSLILTEQQKIEDLWKNSADAIKNIYDRLIDDIKEAFDKAINAHGYDSEDLYTEGKNTRQMQQDEVVDDYERLYRLTNLQRKVDKDIDDRLKANLKNNQRLIALQEEINNLKETGQEMSEYELELLEKKYEYELAMAELEDDTAAKSTVRLTRDRNGNWGYVFSAAPDENAEYEKQQAASDALYERQKLDQTRLNEVASQIDELGQRYSSEIQNLEQAVINGEITAAEAVAQRAALQAEYQKQLATLMRDLNVAMEDSAITQPLMVERYGDQNATIRDSFNETSNAIVNEARTIQDYFTSTNEAFDDFLTHYQQAIDDYNEEMEQLNSDVSQGTEDFEYLAEQQLKALQKASAEQLQQVRDNIAEMQKVIGEGDETILAEVERFNRLYSQKFQPVIDTNERFLNQLQEILSLLNRIDYDVDNQNTITSQEKLIADQQAKLDQGRTASQKDSGQIAGYDEGGYTGMWGNWGKLAILHEGEQVFNKADTNKLLDAAKILRTLDLQADFFGKGLSFLSEMPRVNEGSESSFQQEVHINANFPGVSSRAEIVAAFSDLENQAYQYANRKYTAIKNTA